MTITLPAINDLHLHLRQGQMTQHIAPYSSLVCGNVIVMPNTKPPIHDVETIKYYHCFYQEALGGDCKVHMTAKLLPHTTTRDIENAKKAGVLGYKLYPAGATTNSDDGIPEQWIINPTIGFRNQIRAIRDNDLVLLCHGEIPSAFCMERENEFLPFLDKILEEFHDLRITLEHISTMQGLQAVLTAHTQGYNILGTFTLQHMLKTHDDVVGGKLRPENHCMPTLKRPQDQKTLLEYAKKAHKFPCIAFGSDSAPHTDELNCGCFSAPVLLQTLYEIFQYDPEAFQAFCVDNGQKFYNLPRNDRRINLRETLWLMPQTLYGILPFRAGEQLTRQVVLQE